MCIITICLEELMLWIWIHQDRKTYISVYIGKIIWENNFITYCYQVKEEFVWGAELIELVSSNRQSKAVYFKEINDLKLEIK